MSEIAGNHEDSFHLPPFTFFVPFHQQYRLIRLLSFLSQALPIVWEYYPSLSGCGAVGEFAVQATASTSIGARQQLC